MMAPLNSFLEKEARISKRKRCILSHVQRLSILCNNKTNKSIVLIKRLEQYSTTTMKLTIRSKPFISSKPFFSKNFTLFPTNTTIQEKHYKLKNGYLQQAQVQCTKTNYFIHVHGSFKQLHTQIF